MNAVEVKDLVKEYGNFRAIKRLSCGNLCCHNDSDSSLDFQFRQTIDWKGQKKEDGFEKPTVGISPVDESRLGK